MTSTVPKMGLSRNINRTMSLHTLQQNTGGGGTPSENSILGIPNRELALRSPVVRGGRDAESPQLIDVILAIEHVPLFAAFQNFFLLRGDFLTHFRVGLLFFAQGRRQNRYHLLPNGVAVFDEFHFVARYKDVCDLMGEPNDFFAAEAHAVEAGVSAKLACGRERAVLSPFCTFPGTRLRSFAFHLDAASGCRALRR